MIHAKHSQTIQEYRRRKFEAEEAMRADRERSARLAEACGGRWVDLTGVTQPSGIIITPSENDGKESLWDKWRDIAPLMLSAVSLFISVAIIVVNLIGRLL